MGEKCTGTAVWAVHPTRKDARMGRRDVRQLPGPLLEEIIAQCRGPSFTPAWASPQILRIGRYSKPLG